MQCKTCLQAFFCIIFMHKAALKRLCPPNFSYAVISPLKIAALYWFLMIVGGFWIGMTINFLHLLATYNTLFILFVKSC